MSIFSLNSLELSNPVIPINTFTSVSLSKLKPLVLCDIDDTVIGYDKNMDFFYDNLKLRIDRDKLANSGPSRIFTSLLNNNHFSNMTDFEIKVYASNMYDDYRQSRKPTHCDYNGFTELVKKAKYLGGELQFLTARSKESADFTRKQFTEIGLNYDDYRVNYTGNAISKGEYITRYFNLNHFGEVVFIDDLDSYIQSVVHLCPSIQCYKFIYKP
jgi:hypothetical protein